MDSMDDVALSGYLKGFVCSRDKDRETFLHELAFVFEKRGLARTDLAIASGSIAGYFTISIRRLKVPETSALSSTLEKRMNVDPGNRVAQTHLLGQLGRADESYSGLGSELIEDAIELVKNANNIVGCRVVRLDCIDGLIHYYENQGFKYLCKTKSDGCTPAH